MSKWDVILPDRSSQALPPLTGRKKKARKTTVSYIFKPGEEKKSKQKGHNYKELVDKDIFACKKKCSPVLGKKKRKEEKKDRYAKLLKRKITP